MTRVPVVGGLAYIEHLRRQPSAFQATLALEPDNRYFGQAITVSAGGAKLGYVAPEVARQYFEQIKGAISAGGPVTCPARRGAGSDHETSGVELLLDFSGFPEPS